ncbi:MAG: J domain-containing protein [Myxococcales bacterium]|jgi:curved DNA-binding protein CbpA
MTLYEILGVRPGARADEIEAAHRLLAARFDPKRYEGRQLGSFGPRLEAIRAAVENAYRTLADPHGRREYDRQLRRQGRGRR